MAKTKYHFNPKLLVFEESQRTIWQKLLRILSYVFTALAFSTVVIFFAYKFLDSPKEKQLKREIEQYKMQYEIIDQQMDEMQLVLNDLQERDNNIYRVIFESDPIPLSERGGAMPESRYAHLQNFDNAEIITAAAKRLDYLSKQIYSQSKSYDEVVKLTKRKNEMHASIPAIFPIKDGAKKIVSGFGMRYHPILKIMRPHTGIDISAPHGTPIYATGNGKVVETSGGGNGYGISVVINHGFGYQTRYAHMSRMTVRMGQKVKRGDLIGYVGNTGLSVAPHCHYEVIKDGQRVNPVHYFFNDLTPEEYNHVIEAASKVNQALS